MSDPMNPLDGHFRYAAQTRTAVEGANSPADQSDDASQDEVVGEGSDTASSHCGSESHIAPAAGGSTPPTTMVRSVPEKATSPGGPRSPAANETSISTRSMLLADPLLALLADVLDDLERTRIANENRVRQLTRDVEDKDGEERGFGLPLHQPQVASLHGVVEALKALEHEATLNLRRRLRQHPLAPWMAAQKGVGEKQGARLLASIGDPYWNTLHDRPRTVSELWAYCGLHVLRAGQVPTEAQSIHADSDQPRSADRLMSEAQSTTVGGVAQTDPGQRSAEDQRPNAGVAASRARGQKANWNPAAKMRAYLVAEACTKQRCTRCTDAGKERESTEWAQPPADCTCEFQGYGLRAIYDAGRQKYADAVHLTDCRRCGPAGHPAPVGSPLSAAHQHARALRLVMKNGVLKGLWLEARRLHGIEDEQEAVA